MHASNYLEVLWGINRPKELTPITKFRNYIICSFYSLPSGKKNRKFLNHLASSTHAIMTRFPGAAIFLGGDKNSFPLAPQSVPVGRPLALSAWTMGLEVQDKVNMVVKLSKESNMTLNHLKTKICY